MSHPLSLQVGAPPSVADSEKSFQEQRATTAAMAAVVVHFLSFIVVIGWLYFFVPPVKQELDSLGTAISRNKISLILQSDFVVNYWYLFVGAAPILLVFDFLLIRLIGKEFRLSAAIGLGVIIAMLNLAYPIVGSYILSH
jgi:type II secretory pathway component PulF